LYGQGFFPASRGPFRVRFFNAVHRGTLPLANVGRPLPFFKVGIVYYNWSTILGPLRDPTCLVKCLRWFVRVANKAPNAPNAVYNNTVNSGPAKRPNFVLGESLDIRDRFWKIGCSNLKPWQYNSSKSKLGH
jgi:hypothetical protein